MRQPFGARVATSPTPAGSLSVLDYGAKGNDAGDGAGNDDTQAFLDCWGDCLKKRMHPWVPPSGRGAYRIADEVLADPGTLDGQVFRVRGGGEILCDNPTGNIFRFVNFEIVTFDLHLRGKVTDPTGTPQRTRTNDCDIAFRADFCRMAHITGRHFWLGCGNADLYCGTASGLWVRDFLLEGVSAAAAVIRAVDWSQFVLEHVEIDDIGGYAPNGAHGGNAVGSGPNQQVPPAWIRIQDPYAPLLGSFSQQSPILRNVWLDESAAQGVLVNPTTYRIASMVMEDVRASAYRVNAALPTLDVKGVDALHMRRSSAARLEPGDGVASSSGIALRNVKRAVLDGCRVGHLNEDANTIYVDSSCGVVELRNMIEGTDYRTVTASAPVIRPPSAPTLAGTVGDGSNWTITPGSGGGLVERFARTRNGALDGTMYTATGSAVSFLQPTEIGPLWGVIAIGPGGQSERSNELQGATPPSGFTLWLNPESISSSSSNIDSWANEGSAGGAYSQTGGNRPTVVTISGKPTAHFVAGSSQYLAGGPTIQQILGANPQPGYCIAAVIRVDAHAGSQANGYDRPAILTDSNGSGGGNAYPLWITASGIGAGQFSVAADHDTAAIAVTNGVTYFVMMWHDGTNLHLQVGSTTATPVAAAAGIADTIATQIGANYARAAFTSITICEMVAYPSAAPSGGTRADIETYMRAQWSGIT